MELMNEALKYVVQAKQLLDKHLDDDALKELKEILEKAEEALVKAI
jgi:hypothetical protein